MPEVVALLAFSPPRRYGGAPLLCSALAGGAPGEGALPDAVRGRLVLLAGGKTGGHVFPALAVAEELVRRGARAEWVGTAAGLEERLARSRGLGFHALPAAPLVGRGALQRLVALCVLLRSAWRGRALVRRTGAAVVVGTGGFVSAPAVLGAWLARRPILLLEPNAEAGVANRLLSRFAAVAAIAHQGAATGLRCPTVLTGVPVRPALFAVAAAAAPRGDERRLLVLGGSQGARALNAAVPEALGRLADGGAVVAALHQTGADHLAETESAYAARFERSGDRRFRRGLVTVELAAFVDDVPAALSRADLVVSRAGAITLAELCAAGRASLLVPLELAGGHQARNAEALERAGAAEVVRERELAGLDQALRRLLEEPARVVEMAARARALAQPEAARRIADRVAELLAGEAGR
jgi:UDP-N-acetylglucosamine--N-acetylmuramyl-(pentapeptide) pyrophosphoryl-undecaprenol N-acetylglucosamine transferase